MKIKKLLPFIAFLPLLGACHHIDEDETLIPVEKQPLQRNVLLEEFTGQMCVNCPDAHEEIEKLVKQYGDKLIVVSVHALEGQFGISVDDGGLMQPEGDMYADHWKITALPCGVVDGQNSVLTYDQWNTAIRRAGAIASNMELSLDAELSGDGKTINIKSDLFADRAVTGNFQLWVVEDGLVAQQRIPTGRIPNYVHNNVYRASVNGLWGEPVDLKANQSWTFENSIAMHIDQEEEIDNWNPDNLYIVGFVYNSSEVLVVEKTKVK